MPPSLPRNLKWFSRSSPHGCQISFLLGKYLLQAQDRLLPEFFFFPPHPSTLHVHNKAVIHGLSTGWDGNSWSWRWDSDRLGNVAALEGSWPRVEDRNISQKLFCCLLFWWLIFSLVWYRRHPVVPVPSRDGGWALQGAALPENLKALTWTLAQTLNVPLFGWADPISPSPNGSGGMLDSSEDLPVLTSKGDWFGSVLALLFQTFKTIYLRRIQTIKLHLWIKFYTGKYRTWSISLEHPRCTQFWKSENAKILKK